MRKDQPHTLWSRVLGSQSTPQSISTRAPSRTGASITIRGTPSLTHSLRSSLHRMYCTSSPTRSSGIGHLRRFITESYCQSASLHAVQRQCPSGSGRPAGGASGRPRLLPYQALWWREDCELRGRSRQLPPGWRARTDMRVSLRWVTAI